MERYSAMMIGNFDGVHLGHRALVDAARAATSGGAVVALAFDPHPATVLRPGSQPPRLSTRRSREIALLEAGCDEVRFIEPTPAFLSQTPDEFIAWIVEEFRPRWILEGADFRFGRDREGDLDLLRDRGVAHGYEVIVVPEVELRLDGVDVAVHSGEIRRRLQAGDVSAAASMLGRRYALTGSVVSGDRRGRELGIPTANLDHGELLLPADGIYAGTANDPDGRVHRAAISVGTKPTFEQTPRVCEVHLVDHAGPVDEYGWPLAVEFQHRLREQIAYDGIEPLLEQLKHDLDETRRRVELPSQGG